MDCQNLIMNSLNSLTVKIKSNFYQYFVDFGL